MSQTRRPSTCGTSPEQSYLRPQILQQLTLRCQFRHRACPTGFGGARSFGPSCAPAHRIWYSVWHPTWYPSYSQFPWSCSIAQSRRTTTQGQISRPENLSSSLHACPHLRKRNQTRVRGPFKSKKKVFLRFFDLLLIFLLCLLFSRERVKSFSIFNCLFLILVFFLLFLSCFSGVFIFLIFPVNISHKKLFCDFFPFWTFWKGEIHWTKKKRFVWSKTIIWIFFKWRIIFFFEKKNYFHIDKRWGSRARLQALLTNGASRDEVEGVRSMCIPLSIDLSRGTSVTSSHLSPFFCSTLFFSKLYVEKKKFCECLSVPFGYFCKFFEHLCDFFFLLFSFSCFYFNFPLLFFLLLLYCQGDQKAEDKTRHQDKWVKAVVGMVNKVWKGVFCWSVFQHDRRSELMGLDQPGRMPWLIILG